MRRINLLIMLGISLIGLAACNDENVKNLPVFKETVEFENTGLSFPENIGTVNVPIILSGFSKSDVELTVKVYKDSKDTTAVEGVNFNLPQKTIVIPAGQSVGHIPLEIINDNEVNVNRSFRLWISQIEGAEPARISQIVRIVIVNEDFWPEIQFSAAKYVTTEHEDKLIIPVSALGIFYRPMDVKLRVKDGTAKQGENFVVETTDFHFEDSTRMGLVVTIPQQDISQDLDFTLEWEVLNGGITGQNKVAKVTIKDVRKKVHFAKEEFSVLVNAKPILIPVVFAGMRTPRDVKAVIGVKGGGLASGDYTLEDDVLTTKGDTTLYVKFKLKEGVPMPTNPIEFEIKDVQGGEIADTLLSTQMTITTGVKIDPKVEPWSIVSFSSQELTGEGAKNGRAIQLIDGDLDTYWHSKWQNGNDNAPFTIVVDMAKKIEIGKIGLYRRQQNNNSDTHEATVEVSMDKTEWVSAANYNFKAGGLTKNGLEKELPASLMGRYLRITVTKCKDNNVASLGEVVIWGIQRD